MPFATIEQAIEEIREGHIVIVVDDEDRENEGDLVCAAEKVTPDIINFMSKHGRGLICLPMTEERCDYLQLPPQVTDNTSNFGTAFTITIEAKRGVTTGISAADRATTVLTAVDAKSGPHDLARPGHIFPLRARNGGVLMRPGQTEAAVDLARLAGLIPAGVICEVMNDDGTMARLPQLAEFAKKHGLKIISVADLIRYRMRTELLVQRLAESRLPTIYGEFRAVAFCNSINRDIHLAMVKGELDPERETLVRVHTQCILGDIFGNLMDDIGWQLHRSLERIAEEGSGVVLYLQLEERSQDMVNHILAYQKLQQHSPSAEALSQAIEVHGNPREYGIGAQILHALGLRKIRLLTKHPRKYAALEGFGIQVAGCEPFDPPNQTDTPEEAAQRLKSLRDLVKHE